MTRFRGLENTPLDPKTEIQPDLILPLNDPDMKLCVNVLAAGRPNYLYISLDSIFRNTVFADGSENVPDVYLYVDKMSNGDSYAAEMLKVASHFPVRGVFINKDHKGTVANYWHSFSQAFEMGYNYCILIEEDWLITTKALQWFYDVPKTASHYSLYRWTDRIDPGGWDAHVYDKFCHDEKGYTVFKEGKFLSWCVAFEKEAYKFIQSVIRANGVWGLYGRKIPVPEIRRTSYIDWDATLIAIIKHYALLSTCPRPNSHLAHFGCQTSNYWGYGSGVNRHEQMFEGQRGQWLDNVIEIFETTTEEEKTKLHLYPLTFKYS